MLPFLSLSQAFAQLFMFIQMHSRIIKSHLSASVFLAKLQKSITCDVVIVYSINWNRHPKEIPNWLIKFFFFFKVRNIQVMSDYAANGN